LISPGTFVLEALTAATMVVGTFFMVLTGIGLLRLPDVYTRMHAAGKAGTTGVALLILAPAIWFAGSEPFVTVRGLLAIGFQFLTTPGATYLLTHAAYVRQYPRHRRTALDELQDWIPVYPDDEFGRD
jgi:multicomponent Na+:H+ antiporter subunit G